jgi:YhcH/YjgK/YiaL family protein
MIIGYLSNIENELPMYPSAIQRGLKFLLETDLSALDFGRFEIEGTDLYVSNKKEYDTKPKEQNRLEAHFEYVDIHYIVSGEEIHGVAPLTAVGDIDEDRRLKGGDAIFYKSAATETEFLLSAGMFGVYFPWDVHRNECNVGNTSCKARRIIVKIPMNSLFVP